MITAGFITVIVRNSDLTRLARPVPGLAPHSETDGDLTGWNCGSPREARVVIDVLCAAGLRWCSESRVFDQIAVHQAGLAGECEWLNVKGKSVELAR